MEDWILWKVRPPPKREKKLPTAQEPETLGYQRLSEVRPHKDKLKMGEKNGMVYWMSWHITRETLGTSGLKEGVSGAGGV
jgi:hypothetical protein